jgi:hypothetical protein
MILFLLFDDNATVVGGIQMARKVEKVLFEWNIHDRVATQVFRSNEPLILFRNDGPFNPNEVPLIKESQYAFAFGITPAFKDWLTPVRDLEKQLSDALKMPVHIIN